MSKSFMFVHSAPFYPFLYQCGFNFEQPINKSFQEIIKSMIVNLPLKIECIIF